MGFDNHSSPIDATSARALAERGLRFELLDTSDTSAYDSWLQAVTRGFHGSVLDADGLELRRTNLVHERMSGVWDAASADPATPIATASGWATELTVPGGRPVAAWAISSITVAPTHRRRTIARNLIESELRQAQSLGVPVAILTVTEGTIYTRFGFAPAAQLTRGGAGRRHPAASTSSRSRMFATMAATNCSNGCDRAFRDRFDSTGCSGTVCSESPARPKPATYVSRATTTRPAGCKASPSTG
jgi:ribosomal protein S18 acetylase RimI-like enzyme